MSSPLPPLFALAVSCLALGPLRVSAVSCGTCHPGKFAKWSASPHANTQTDLAVELAQNRAGQTPDDVIHGPDAEDCVACHAPTAVLANGGISEVQVLSRFFTTSNGLFTADTTVINTTDWPQVSCVTCHSAPANHLTEPDHGPFPSLALFDSQTAQYNTMAGASQLCGQCHGSLHFANTDHRVYDAWATSKHAHTQADLAAELADERLGQTPEEVIRDPDGEDCIACHAPTAVLATGGDAAMALGYFFTTANGLFATNTAPAHTAQWPNVACTACHDPHNPGQLAFFNSDTLSYEPMPDSAHLCGQCHGNLRFPDTDHLTYNLLQGTGGIGVPDQQLMPGATCTDCHMHRSDVDGSNSSMFGGHSWAIAVPEADGSMTVSCLKCHVDADPQIALRIVDAWKGEFQALDATAAANVARAADAMRGVADPGLQAALNEAQHNLAYAESDESGGFHNHTYLMALLQDANAKALSIPTLTVTAQGANVVISWTGTAALQSATSLAGPWHQVTNAPGSLILTPAAQGPARFYRLQR